LPLPGTILPARWQRILAPTRTITIGFDRRSTSGPALARAGPVGTAGQVNCSGESHACRGGRNQWLREDDVGAPTGDEHWHPARRVGLPPLGTRVDAAA